MSSPTRLSAKELMMTTINQCVAPIPRSTHRTTARAQPSDGM
jgi:hypothetical protein